MKTSNNADKLDALAKLRGCQTQKAFASYLDVSEQTLSNWYKGRAFPATKILKSFPEVSLPWLMTGEGDMLIDVSAKKGEDMKSIPLYDVDVCAGYGETFPTTEEVRQYISIPALNDCDCAFPVYGDSMEADFYAGDIVIVKEIRNVQSMLWGEPYLIITNANCDNLRTLKNVYISEDREHFILRATNPRYAGDTIVPCADVVKIYLVKGKITRRQY